VRRHNFRFDDATEEAHDRLLGEYKPVSWWELQGRLVIYGSDEIHTAFEASHNADTKVAAAAIRLVSLEQQAKDATSSRLAAHIPDVSEIQLARKELKEAHGSADVADQALSKLARAELNGRPSAAITLQSRLGGRYPGGSTKSGDPLDAN
jgi:hypothetical protein